jgi:hypothetical protein
VTVSSSWWGQQLGINPRPAESDPTWQGTGNITVLFKLFSTIKGSTMDQGEEENMISRDS